MPAADELITLCARCGYNLRGLPSDRCPECGFELAGQSALGGEIPWTYRRPRGRAPAFVQTVLKVVGGGHWFERVVAGPMSLSDARSFWLLASTLASLPLVMSFVYGWIRAKGLWFVEYVPDASLAGIFGPQLRAFGLSPPLALVLPAWFLGDVMWPVSAGLTRPGVAIVCLWLFVLLGSGSMTYLFHPRWLEPTRRRRASALGYYTCGPLVIAAIPFTCVGACIAIGEDVASAPVGMLRLLTTLMSFLWAAVMLIWFGRLLQALRRATGCGVVRSIVSALLVPLLWLASAVFALGFVPWCVGMAWLLFDALR